MNIIFKVYNFLRNLFLQNFVTIREISVKNDISNNYYYYLVYLFAQNLTHLGEKSQSHCIVWLS